MAKNNDVAVIDENGTDVENIEGVKAPRLLDEDTVRSISTYEEAVIALRAALGGQEIEKASSYEVVDDKATLIGVKMMFMNWRFNESSLGGFVSVEAITHDGRKIVINDGSKGGIRDQLADLTEKRILDGQTLPQAHAALEANSGLRKSDYTTADGAAGDGTSWYVQGLPPAKRR